jgi:hypothetical protein
VVNNRGRTESRCHRDNDVLGQQFQVASGMEDKEGAPVRGERGALVQCAKDAGPGARVATISASAGLRKRTSHLA